MTTRTWNGAAGSFVDAAAWSPAGVPGAGDVAVIDAGTVSVSGIGVQGVAFRVGQANGAASSVTLALAGADLDATSSLTFVNAQSMNTVAPAVLAVSFATTFGGVGSFYGTTTQIRIADGGSLTLKAGAVLDFYGSSPVTAGPGTLVNDGTIALLNPGNGIGFGVFNAPLSGTGVVALGEHARLELAGPVGPGQSIVFNDGGSGQEQLQIDSPSTMKGVIRGFSASDRISVFGLSSYETFAYVADAGGAGGTLQVMSGGAVVASLAFVGQYAQTDFGVSKSSAAGGVSVSVTTTSTANATSLGLPPGFQGGGGTVVPPAQPGQPAPPVAPVTPVPPVPPAAPDASLPVYRFFDSVYGTHLFTQSQGEARSIVAGRPDLVQETNGFGAVAQSSPSAVPIYRFFEQANGTHFFTSSQAEFAGLTTPGGASYRPDFTYESSSTFYEHMTQQAGDVAVHRLFDTVQGTQFLTGDQNEYAGLTTRGSATFRADFRDEGVAFYAPSGSYRT